MTSVFYNNYNHYGEQELLANMVTEVISIYGHEIFYIPRNIGKFDQVYGADDQSTFTNTYLTDTYIKNTEGFNGDSNFLSKFGLEIRDRVTFCISTQTFDKDIGLPTGFSRPREGDIIYFPLNKKCFDIKFVDDKPFFYQLGKLQMYDLYCELFEYSDEKFSTGIAEIDLIQRNSVNLLEYATTDANGAIITDANGNIVTSNSYNLDIIDPLQNNDEIQRRSDEIVTWDINNPFSANGV